MTIASEITRLQNDKAAMCAAIENKGVTVGNVTFDDYAACIDAIPSLGKTVDFLLIAGGGGGGGSCYSRRKGGGGGGAGGAMQCYGCELEGGTYSVVIGCGGNGGAANCSNCGCNGGNSTFNGITMYGGGGGVSGGYCSSGLCGRGKNGGSGGGSYLLQYCCDTYRTVACDSRYGSEGGRAFTCYTPTSCCNSGDILASNGGGGGGAGGQGGDSTISVDTCLTTYNASGQGGKGIFSEISGDGCWYAGGGGGGIVNCSCITGRRVCLGVGLGGLGGGGSGIVDCCDATYYGGGGGGGGCSRCGGKGCGGVFIIRYKTGTYNATGGICYTCGDYTIHCFTSSGTLTIS